MNHCHIDSMGNSQYVPKAHCSHDSFTLTFIYYLLLFPAHDNNSFVGYSGKMELYHFGPFLQKPLACVFSILKNSIANMQSLASNITITTCYILAAKNKELTLRCESNYPHFRALFHFGTRINIELLL